MKMHRRIKLNENLDGFLISHDVYARISNKNVLLIRKNNILTQKNIRLLMKNNIIFIDIWMTDEEFDEKTNNKI